MMAVMTAQPPLPLTLEGARPVGTAAAIVEDDAGGRVFVHGNLAYAWDVDDAAARRFAAVSLMRIKAATQLEVAEAFAVTPARCGAGRPGAEAAWPGSPNDAGRAVGAVPVLADPVDRGAERALARFGLIASVGVHGARATWRLDVALRRGRADRRSARCRRLYLRRLRGDFGPPSPRPRRGVRIDQLTAWKAEQGLAGHREVKTSCAEDRAARGRPQDS